MSRVRANQNAESPESTRPLSGISVGRTTSKVEIRSLATSNSRSSSIVNSSRTLPLATWTSVSDMHGLLMCGQGVESFEDGVEMSRVRAEVEGLAQVDPAGDPLVGLDERREVQLLVPGPEGVLLDEPVRLVPRQAGLDEREQDALAEEEAVTRVEVRTHPAGEDDEALDEPRKAVEHVVEREERIRQNDPLGRGVRDVALVPEGDVLETDRRGAADDTGEPADPLGDDRVPLVRHRRGALLAGAERLLHLAHLGAGEVADLEGEPVERGCDEREDGEELGVPVTGHDLGGDRLRLEP